MHRALLARCPPGLMSSALTRGILVTVRSQYIPERSSAPARQFAFAYTVNIANRGDGRRPSSRAGTGSSPTPEATCRRCAAKAWSGAQPRPAPGRGVRVHELVHDRDAGGIDARQLPDGDRRRRPLRRRDRPVPPHASRASSTERSSRPRRRGSRWSASAGRPAPRTPSRIDRRAPTSFCSSSVSTSLATSASTSGISGNASSRGMTPQ